MSIAGSRSSTERGQAGRENEEIALAFTALPAHVRTARLIATAVARRSGVDEAALDEVRLAVGEACLRAVETHRRFHPAAPVRLSLSGAPSRFEVVVAESLTDGQMVDGAPDSTDSSHAGVSANSVDQPPDLGLAIIAGLADDVEIRRTPAGAEIRMSWPVTRKPE